MKSVETKIHEIANQINSHMVDMVNGEPFKFTNGLYSGYSGCILYSYCYAQYFERQDIKDNTDKFIEKITDNFNLLLSESTYCSGLAGLLCLLDFLNKKKFISIDTEEIDDYLQVYFEEEIDQYIRSNFFDFMHGAIGLGLYALQNRDTKTLNCLIDFLYTTAYKDGNVFYWETNIGGPDNTTKENISLSHGVSSIVIFLSRLARCGYYNEMVKEMLIKGVRYLQSNEIDFEKYGSCFPHYSKNSGITKSRLGWCYGDLSVAIALKEAAIVLKDDSLLNFSIDVFSKNIQKKEVKDTMVYDAGICHGSAGIAMMYNRMYKDTGIADFKINAEFWIEETLNHAIYEDGLCGYKTLLGNKWEIDYSLLTGISGIGLVLMSHLMNDGQEWDELFLLSYNTEKNAECCLDESVSNISPQS